MGASKNKDILKKVLDFAMSVSCFSSFSKNKKFNQDLELNALFRKKKLRLN